MVKGAGRGRELGFPTANLSGITTLLPPAGVYGGIGQFGSREYPAAIHIGPNPTFADEASKVEIHLIECSGELYGETLKVDFLGELRDVRKFANAEELKEQLEIDVHTVQSLVSSYHPR